MEGRSVAILSDCGGPVSVESWREKRLGTWFFEGGLQDKIIDVPSQIAGRSLHAFPSQILTHSICPWHSDALLTPCVESDTTQTDNPFQSLSFDVTPPTHPADSQHTNKHVCAMHVHKHTHTQRVGEDLRTQHATMFWVLERVKDYWLSRAVARCTDTL